MTAPLPLALTMGDPAGIGPEITIKAWHELRRSAKNCFFVIGDPALYEGAKIIKTPAKAAAVFPDNLPVLPIDCPSVRAGTPSSATAKAIITSIKMAVGFTANKQASAVVTNPIAKEVLYKSGFEFPGHTEFLGALTADMQAPYARGPVMMLMAKDLRVALVTIHMPLKDVATAITKTRIIRAAEIMHGALRLDFGIKNPRIAMTGLNPHAGEGGALGSAETDILIPAAEALRAHGIIITDPQPADTLFHEEARRGYDAVMAMYHDQGLIPVKTLDFHGGVNTTLGLPIVRTSPDHGTAFDIAGRGIARPDSLLAAIIAAQNMSAKRTHHG